jgi:intracellular septation protein
MRTALLQLGEDFLSAIVFLIAYLATNNLMLAVILAVTVGAIQFAVAKVRGRPIELMQWLGFALVIVLGAAALITDDSRFMMVKPSIVHLAIGAIMLRPGWMLRYLPPIVKDNLPEMVLVASGYAWAGLMIALGLINFYVATNYSVQAWAWFITFGAIGAKVVALAIQYVVFRVMITRRLREAS